MTTIYDTLLATQTIIELYKSKGYNDVQISSVLALEKINKAIEKTNGVYTTQKLNAIKKLIQEEIIKAYGGLFESLQDESVAIANVSYGAVVGASLSASLPKAAIADLINSKRQIQGYDFKELFDLTATNHERALRVSFASSIAAGMTPTQITKELKDKNVKLLNGNLKTNVTTVIFDALDNGAYVGYRDLEKTGIIEYYEHHSVLDSRTSEICRTLDNRKYYVTIDTIPEEYRPPIHFLCRSKLVPVAKGKLEGTRASQFGAVPDNESYPTWFKKQSPEFQRTTLGNKKFNAYKNGTYKIESLADVVGKKMDLKEVVKSVEDYVAVPKVPVIDFGYDGKFNGYVADIRDEAKIVIDKLPKPNEISLVTQEEGSMYSGIIKLLNTEDNARAFTHEYGHHIDASLRSYKKGLSYEELFEEFAEDAKEVKNMGLKDIFKVLVDSGYEKTTYKATGLSDMFTGANHSLFYSGLSGHSKKYYEIDGNIESEAFANMFQMWSMNETWEETKKIFPNSTSKFELIMKDIIDGKHDK